MSSGSCYLEGALNVSLSPHVSKIELVVIPCVEEALRLALEGGEGLFACEEPSN